VHGDVYVEAGLGVAHRIGSQFAGEQFGDLRVGGVRPTTPRTKRRACATLSGVGSKLRCQSIPLLRSCLFATPAAGGALAGSRDGAGGIGGQNIRVRVKQRPRVSNGPRVKQRARVGRSTFLGGLGDGTYIVGSQFEGR